jgi:hypothetical protein
VAQSLLKLDEIDFDWTWQVPQKDELPENHQDEEEEF